MSTNSILVGKTRCGFTNPSRTFNLASGTEITPTLGSIVQNGKLAASALLLAMALNKVDFPTFGNPTIPHCKPIAYVLTYNKGRKYKALESKVIFRMK
jgi:hypothetical protein